MSSHDVSSVPTPVCTVIGKFRLGNKTCELLAFHQPGENVVSGKEVLLRGREAKASMTEKAFWFFWDRRDSVPWEHLKKFFVFPETSVGSGGMRCAGQFYENWYHYLGQPGGIFVAGFVLVRLS